MNCTPKVGYPLQLAKVQFFMTQYTLNKAVFHYLRIRSRQRTQTITASSASTYAAGEPHTGKAVSEHLNAPSSLNLKKPSPVAYRTQLMQTAWTGFYEYPRFGEQFNVFRRPFLLPDKPSPKASS
jgi:transposase